MSSLFARFPLDGVGRYFDIWIDRPLRDEADRQLLIRQTLAFLQFYKERLAYGEEFEAAGAIGQGFRALAPPYPTPPDAAADGSP